MTNNKKTATDEAEVVDGPWDKQAVKLFFPGTLTSTNGMFHLPNSIN
jgi:hypothetical protein